MQEFYLKQLIRLVCSRSAVRSKITSPIMIMKGDGGIIDVATFGKTYFYRSFRARGWCVEALLHLRVLNGIFVEVGINLRTFVL